MKTHGLILKSLTSAILLSVSALLLSGCGTSLSRLIAEGKYEEVGAKLNDGADVNEVDKKSGKTPLMVAIMREHIPTIELLLENGADVNAGGSNTDRPPLYYAISTGNIEVIEILLKDTTNVNDEYNYLLYGEITSMSAYGSTVKGITVRGTALIHCLHLEQGEEIVKLLIEFGAKVNTGDSDSKTPLAFAVEQQRTDLVRYLLANGADPKDKYTYISEKKFVFPGYDPGGTLNTYSERTILELAKSKEYNEIVELLLRAGATDN